MVKTKRQMPTGVKVISILYYIGAVISLTFGILLVAGAGAIADYLTQFMMIDILGSGLLIIAGIILIVMAIVDFFIGRGLWKGMNWARILAVIFAVIGLISSLINLIGGDFTQIFSLVIDGLIGWYLWFNVNVKKAFS